MSTNKIFDCQANLAALLTNDEFFNDTDPAKKIPVISQRVGNIQNAIDMAIQRISVGVVVMLPMADDLEPDYPSNRFALHFVIIVTENPMANKTGKPAEMIVEKILSLLKWKSNGVDPGDFSDTGRFTTSARAFEQTPDPKRPQLLNYMIRISTEVDITPTN